MAKVPFRTAEIRSLPSHCACGAVAVIDCPRCATPLCRDHGETLRLPGRSSYKWVKGKRCRSCEVEFSTNWGRGRPAVVAFAAIVGLLIVGTALLVWARWSGLVARDSAGESVLLFAVTAGPLVLVPTVMYLVGRYRFLRQYRQTLRSLAQVGDEVDAVTDQDDGPTK